MGHRQPAARGGELRRPAREGRRAPRQQRPLRRRRLRRRRPRAPDRRARDHRPPLPRPVREDDVHRADGRRARGLRARGSRPACARGRGRPRRGRHPHRGLRRAPSGPQRGPDRRHLLRRRDQEVDLHGHERPAAAGGRLPDALLGERRRRGPRRDLLRPLRDRQDDALRRPRALADRRRRARLGRQRCLQHRGRLLREGDPPLRRGRARDLQDHPHVRDDPRERHDRRERRARPRRRLEDREHARRLQARADRQRAADEAGRPPERGRDADRGRLRDPPADRAADARPGALLLPLRLHGEGRRHGDRGDRAAGDVLDLLRLAVPAAGAGGLRTHARREARRAPRGDRLARQHRLDGRAVRRGPPDADRSDARPAARRARGRASRRRVPHRPDLRLRGAGLRARRRPGAPRPALDLERPGRVRPQGPASSRGCSATTSRSSRSRPGADVDLRQGLAFR